MSNVSVRPQRPKRAHQLSRSESRPPEGSSRRSLLIAQAQALRAQAEVLEQLASESENARAGDRELVDRRTSGVSGRLWDRLVASGELAVMKDGRRYVAYRSDVVAALERRRVLRKEKPKTVDRRDEYEQLLARAGVRLDEDD